MVACDDKEKPAADGKITVTPPSLGFTAAGGTETVDVTGINWTHKASAEWIEVTASEGRITVTVGKNEVTEPRSGSIEVKNADDTKTITVSQEAAGEPPVIDDSLEIDPSELSFPAAGETQTVMVTSERQWTATTDDDWLTIDETENSFSVTADANDIFETRTGSILVSNGVESENKTIAVTQEAAVDPYSDLTFVSGAWAMSEWNGLGYELTLQTAENITGDGYRIILGFDDGTGESNLEPLPGTYTWKTGTFKISRAIVETYTGGASGGEVNSTDCTMVIGKEGETYTITVDGVLEDDAEYHLRYIGSLSFLLL